MEMVEGKDDAENQIQQQQQQQQQQGFQTLLTSIIANATSTTSTVSGNPSPYDSQETFFYSKLTELLDFSGFSLIFNVRETLLDLYLFYTEVTKRGGFHQVCRENKWGEVVSALKLEGSNVKLCGQIEILYAHLLYQFEQLYFYRRPAKRPAASSAEDGEIVTPVCKDYTCQVREAGYIEHGFVEQPVLLPPSLNNKEKKTSKETKNNKETKNSKEMKDSKETKNNKETKKPRCAPMGLRNPYHIFVKQECARLKSCGQASVGSTFLSMATEAWRKMSEVEKQPYLEESKKNKEKFKEAMIAHKKEQEQNKQESKEEKSPSVCSDYHVSSQPEAGVSLVVNEAEMGLALKMTEKAPKDPSFFIDLDAHFSVPTGESK